MALMTIHFNSELFDFSKIPYYNLGIFEPLRVVDVKCNDSNAQIILL